MKMVKPNFVVGIGGAAGALTAYKAFFEELPATTGMAFVVIFQMNPAADSQLASVLSRHTKMPVIVPTTGMPIRKNHVYVIPSNADLCIDRDTFKVISPCTNKGNVVDIFLVSLAEALGPRAIAIILSGHGHDGTEGCKRIKARGGGVLPLPKTGPQRFSAWRRARRHQAVSISFCLQAKSLLNYNGW
jgi:two-component system CheB/CheR fusion protein